VAKVNIRLNTTYLRSWYCVRQLAYKEQCSFDWESGCGLGKDDTRPLVRVGALCFLQCFDTDSWEARRTYGPQKTPFHQSSDVLFRKGGGGPKGGGEAADPGSPEKKAAKCKYLYDIS